MKRSSSDKRGDSAGADDALAQRLRRHGITPTAQRLRIARILFERPQHLSAERLIARLRSEPGQRVSKATVYNTLGLFTRAGLVREVIADPSRVFYDSTTREHHHLYDAETGTLTDIELDQLEIGALPPIPDGLEVEGVDIVVRVRRRV